MAQQTILCVDDETNILNALKRLLRGEGYAILTASNGEEGLSILEKESVQMVISDYVMPKMTGIEFLSQVKKRYPNILGIILTGSISELSGIINSNFGGEFYRFLEKPWNDDELKQTIREGLKHLSRNPETGATEDEP